MFSPRDVTESQQLCHCCWMQIVHQKNEYQRSLLRERSQHTTCLFSATERCPSSARLFVSGSFPPRPTDLMPLFLYQLEDVISINHGYSIHGEWFWMERLPSKEATVLSSLMASKNALKQLLGGSCSHGTVRNGSEGGVTLMHCSPMVVRCLVCSIPSLKPCTGHLPRKE